MIKTSRGSNKKIYLNKLSMSIDKMDLGLNIISIWLQSKGIK